MHMAYEIELIILPTSFKADRKADRIEVAINTVDIENRYPWRTFRGFSIRYYCLDYMAHHMAVAS